MPDSNVAKMMAAKAKGKIFLEKRFSGRTENAGAGVPAFLGSLERVDQLPVVFGRKKGADFAHILKLEFDHPGPIIGILVRRARLIRERGVYFQNLSRERRIEIAHCLDALDHAEGLTPFERLAFRGKFHENHFPQSVLRVVRDADRGDLAFDVGPFVVFGVLLSAGNSMFGFCGKCNGWRVEIGGCSGSVLDATPVINSCL